jgi:hypothetical protein
VLEEFMEVFSPCADENTPGCWLLDKYPDRVMFTTFNPKEENALPKHQNLLNAIYAQSRADSTRVCCGTDCSIPKCSSYQATALLIIEQAGRETLKSTWVAGRVLSTDAELFVVRMAVCKAVTLEDCHHIIIFTDSMVVAKQAVNLSVHSGQAHSFAICKALAQWFAISENHRVEFIATLSKLEWGLQYAAHCCARSLPAIPMGRRPATSLDGMQKHITNSALNSWSTMFQDKKYCSHHFLPLVETKGTIIAPMYANGGSWLRFVGEDVKTCTHMCRAILDHAPISDYYCRFNIPEAHSCLCGAARQSRKHLFTRCPDLDTNRRTPKLLNKLIRYLQKNPTVFGFKPPSEGIG